MKIINYVCVKAVFRCLLISVDMLVVQLSVIWLDPAARWKNDDGKSKLIFIYKHFYVTCNWGGKPTNTWLQNEAVPCTVTLNINVIYFNMNLFLQKKNTSSVGINTF